MEPPGPPRLRLHGPPAARGYCAEPQKAPSHEGRASEEDVSLGVCLFTAHDAPARSAGDIGDCRHSSVKFLRIRCM